MNLEKLEGLKALHYQSIISLQKAAESEACKREMEVSLNLPEVKESPEMTNHYLRAVKYHSEKRDQEMSTYATVNEEIEAIHISLAGECSTAQIVPLTLATA